MPITRGKFPIVVIGASAGGIQPLQQLFRELTPTTGMAFVVIQHLDPNHDSYLSTIIGRVTPMEVTEATQRARIKPNHVYVIPPNRTMTVQDDHLELHPRAKQAPARCVDHFMISLAHDRKDKAIGIVLSGNASDGTRGLEAIKHAGGLTFAMDERLASFPGMPQSAIASGHVDFVLSPEQIARELIHFAHHRQSPIAQPKTPASEEEALQEIFVLLQKGTKINFAGYKLATIRRRLERRMALHKIKTIIQYADFLKKHPIEMDAIAQDFLIKVTTFFRDPDMFRTLKDQVLPKLVEGRSRTHPIRIWIPGCSTGEEVYSFAIALTEYLENNRLDVPFQIFATDVSDLAINKARNGLYTESSLTHVSPDQLNRFFIKTKSGYHVAKRIRDVCIFARQDLTKDPPFSRIDLISCRNLLIYLDVPIQKKIFPMFHYALKPSGFLILGSSESAGRFGHLFTLLDRKHKIFARRLTHAGREALRAFDPYKNGERSSSLLEKTPIAFRGENWQNLDVQREIDRFFLSRYAPVSILVNEHLDVIQFRGPTSAYLEPQPGKASMNILQMVRSTLRQVLRAVLHQAMRMHTPVRKESFAIRHEGRLKKIHLEIIPIYSTNVWQYLIIFEDATLTPHPLILPANGKKRKKSFTASEVHTMVRENTENRDQLQIIIDEQSSANEEMQAANEEIMSSNEELQSTNEELETAKEELQSTNEELTTVNEELNTRNNELAEVNNDLMNLLSGISIPIVMLDTALRIRRFTPAAEKILKLIPTDVGRPITDITSNLVFPEMEHVLREVIDHIVTREIDVKDRSGRWHVVRIRPYKTRDSKIDGAVLTVTDVDHVKRMETEAKNNKGSHGDAREN